MLTSDGYSLIYHKNKNQIVICLPQTMQTITNTVAMVTKRKMDLTPSEEAMILNVVRFVMEGEYK